MIITIIIKWLLEQSTLFLVQVKMFNPWRILMETKIISNMVMRMKLKVKHLENYRIRTKGVFNKINKTTDLYMGMISSRWLFLSVQTRNMNIYIVLLPPLNCKLNEETCFVLFTAAILMFEIGSET